LPVTSAMHSLFRRCALAEVEDLDSSSPWSRRSGVHPEEVRREERRLLAALAAPDLEDGVLRVVGIGGQEQELHRPSSSPLGLQPGSSQSPSSRSSGSASASSSSAICLLEVAVLVEGDDDVARSRSRSLLSFWSFCGHPAPGVGRGARRARRSGGELLELRGHRGSMISALRRAQGSALRSRVGREGTSSAEPSPAWPCSRKSVTRRLASATSS
jgi:hypothetical protein